MIGRFSPPRGPRPVARAGPFVATMPNGVFGDPLVHVRIPHHKRSLLLDLGEGAKLPARTAHQVSDVLLSHAHADHIAGFISFLRSRIGEWPLCRVYGPPGISGNVAGLVAGIHWDRIGRRAPRFEVTEYDAGKLARFSVVAGGVGPEPLDVKPAPDGIVHTDEIMQIRVAILDHLTPVLAYALESRATIRVRKDALAASGLRPGPWLTDLKDRISAGESRALISLPDGSTRDAALLAAELLMVSAGVKLVYATDLADTPRNRADLQALAAGAHTLFCEAAFSEVDADKAQRTGHLTARACGEIAAAAGVTRLIPFHFSRRYESDPKRLYAEARAACAATVVPDIERFEKSLPAGPTERDA